MLVEKYCEMQRNGYEGPLDKYFETETLKRLKGKGLFCGMDYVGIKSMNPLEYYSKFHHSMNVAHTASVLSEDLSVALAGAFHDVGSLSFAHVNSFKKGEGLTQKNDELNVKMVLQQDKELLEFLKKDGINIDDICDCTKYPLIDKEIPALCLDRLDGILSTCLLFAKTHTIEQIRGLYYMQGYLYSISGVSLDPNNERFQDFEGEMYIEENEFCEYEDFFKAISNYSKILLTKENRYIMQLFGMVLRYYEDIGIIDENDLFNLSEQQIIEKILNTNYSKVWKDFVGVDTVRYALPNQTKGLILYSQPKIRQASPLTLCCTYLCEIDGVSGDFYRELVRLDKAIENTYRPLVGNLNEDTAKVLSKYKNVKK